MVGRHSRGMDWLQEAVSPTALELANGSLGMPRASQESAGAGGNASSAAAERRSFADVRDVDAGHTVPVVAPPPLKRLRQSSAVQLLQRGCVDGSDERCVVKARQDHEDEVAQVVVVCEPEGTSLMMGTLHPRGSLYERPINVEQAKTTHAAFRRVLREQGLRVLTVREILAYGTAEHMGARCDLEDLAMDALRYQLADGYALADVREKDRFYLSDKYKRLVLQVMHGCERAMCQQDAQRPKREKTRSFKYHWYFILSSWRGQILIHIMNSSPNFPGVNFPNLVQYDCRR